MRALVCVINWNTAAHLPAVLATLRAQTHPDLDVAVIDNASRDGSVEVLRSLGDVRCIVNPDNRGFAGAANQAVTLAERQGADALVLCNPDVRLQPDYVARAVAALAAHPRRAAVQGRLWRLPPGGEPDPGALPVLDTTGHQAFRPRLFRNRGEGEVDDGRYDEPGEVFGVSGALGCYRLAALADVACRGEVFDETLFAFWEDVDLDWRLQLRGWQVWYAADACAWHERGGSGPRRSPLVERLNFVNRLLVIMKNDDAAALRGALPEVALTTLLKAGELALTVPTAFAASLSGVVGVPATLARRRLVQSAATVDPAAVATRWFAPFDYRRWVRTWWRRVGPSGSAALPGRAPSSAA